MRYVIVDGYNVIRADPRLQSFERVSLEHARDVLVRTLASSPRLVNDQVVVVFDGAHGSRSHIHSQTRGRILTVYSARGQAADDVVVEHAKDLVHKGRVVVVSNDVEVRENSRAAGAEVSGSENLLSQMPGHPRRCVVTTHEDDDARTVSTRKKGNPRRTSRRTRRQDIRF